LTRELFAQSCHCARIQIAWRGGADNQINRCATGTPRPSAQNSAVTGPHRKRLRGVSDKLLIFLMDWAFCLKIVFFLLDYCG
jgi:hypothetical protein